MQGNVAFTSGEWPLNGARVGRGRSRTTFGVFGQSERPRVHSQTEIRLILGNWEVIPGVNKLAKKRLICCERGIILSTVRWS